MVTESEVCGEVQAVPVDTTKSDCTDRVSDPASWEVQAVPVDTTKSDGIDRISDPASWVPLMNGRLGLPQQMLKNGRRTFLATNGKSRLCEHGQTSSAIASFMSGARQRKNGCTCQNLDGLTASRYAKIPLGWKVPNYFEVLDAIDAPKLELPGGRMARQLPHTADAATVLYMLRCGNVRCAHGNSEAALRAPLSAKNAPKHRKRPCGCKLGACSWRLRRLQNQRGKGLL